MRKMVIKVKGYATMKPYTTHLPSDGELEIPEGTTIGSVFKKLNVPSESKNVIFVNGRHRSSEYRLRPGDTLVFFPTLEGG